MLSIPINFYTEEALFKALQQCSERLKAKYYPQKWNHISWTTFELFKDNGLLIYLIDRQYQSNNQKYIYKALEIRLNPRTD